jgi:uncharacterized protein (TIGR02145 family)
MIHKTRNTLKQWLVIFLFIMTTGFHVQAQVSINPDGAPPNASAMLDVKSSTSGLLPPRMTHMEIDAITAPANGLIIYCTDCGANGTGAFYQFVNGTWYTILSCIAPSRPAAGTSVPSATQVTWNWNTVPGATGYKWGTTAVYASATDMGTATSKTETGLTCNTAYTRYVWAYNACGSSSHVILNSTSLGSSPSAPIAGTNSASQTQINWNWNSVAGATGYKWNTINNYLTATNTGTLTTFSETGLSCNTSYTRYVWAYGFCGFSNAVNLTQITLPCNPGNPCPGVSNVNYGGQTYTSVQIGEQCWLKENINIGNKINGNGNQLNNGVIEKYCYNDLESNCTTYGGLYQWAEMVQYLNGTTNTASWSPVPIIYVKGICPNNWHLPQDAEWATMIDFLGGSSVSGGKLKEQGNLHWSLPNTGATDLVGFTALPGGYKSINGFQNTTLGADFWQVKEISATQVGDRYLYYNGTQVSNSTSNKTDGYSVRCIKDTCNSAPMNPNSGIHIPSPTQIIWNWSYNSDATAYLWNTVNDPNSATEVGQSTSRTETNLICDSAYTRYLWAYNGCGISAVTVLNQTTQGYPPQSVSISVSSNPVCLGATVTFTATQSGLDTLLTYQWRVNGITKTGSNGPTYSYIPANNDIVSCILTTALPCVMNNPATSNSIAMIVNPNNPVSVTIATSENPVCEGTLVTFSATPFNGGSSPAFMWSVNGNYAYGNGSTFTTAPANGDLVTCLLISNISCALYNPATSNTISMTVNPMKEVAISISASQNPVCIGTNVSFSTTTTNGGTLPIYQWKLNGNSMPGANGSTYSYVPSDNDVVSCMVTSDIDCAIGNPAISAPITMAVDSLPETPIEGNHVAEHTQITWHWSLVPDASGYRWNVSNNLSTSVNLGDVNYKTELNLKCDSSYTRYVWAYNVCGNSLPVLLSDSTLHCQNCGTMTINHLAGAVAPVDKTVNYETVSQLPGEQYKCWITSNLGSSHQAVTENDSTEASAGWYWQFNRKQGYKHDGTNRIPNTTWNGNSSTWESSDWTSANDPCTSELGSPWRVPTKTEWNNVYINGNWFLPYGPWNSDMKLHYAGVLHYGFGTLNTRGISGYFWSSTQDVFYTKAWSFIYSNGAGMMSYDQRKPTGCSIRCLKFYITP